MRYILEHLLVPYLDNLASFAISPTSELTLVKEETEIDVIIDPIDFTPSRKHMFPLCQC